ncbi:Palmitoyltransferase ZDHHC20 [Camelus dromedarius]|uniref:Palmitoyltransferase ZDHHC20 n=1 Tax=Camelus dromedarius TaxID=9838 RepID=A0A5N4D964_CAMDR|nr:Palmitoyltransferase ZDHHC20 [Camelus dromedarius]
MFVWSYWMTIFTSPASPSKEFYLSNSEKERYEKEFSQERQQEILRRAARDLPIYTTSASRNVFLRWIITVLDINPFSVNRSVRPHFRTDLMEVVSLLDALKIGEKSLVMKRNIGYFQYFQGKGEFGHIFEWELGEKDDS